MTSTLPQPTTTGPVAASSGLAAEREIAGTAARDPLWQPTEDQLVAVIGQALALKAQAEAALLARIAEAEARGWRAAGVRRR